MFCALTGMSGYVRAKGCARQGTVASYMNYGRVNYERDNFQVANLWFRLLGWWAAQSERRRVMRQVRLEQRSLRRRR